ncbi:MAG: response regulator transcription factor [Verrucomicrobiota bacterium]
MPATTHSVYLLDDHPLLLSGLRSVIDQEDDLKVCGELQQGKGAAEVIAKEDPSVVVLDLELQDSTGMEVLKDLRARGFRRPVLILSMHDEKNYATRAIRNGANGYIMKQEASDRLVDGIRKVIAGDIFLSDPMREQVVRVFARGETPRSTQDQVEGLTDREFEIFELMGKGLSTKKISARLAIAEKTVASHRRAIKDKLGIDDMSALIQHAVEWLKSREGNEFR